MLTFLLSLIDSHMQLNVLTSSLSIQIGIVVPGGSTSMGLKMERGILL